MPIVRMKWVFRQHDVKLSDTALTRSRCPIVGAMQGRAPGGVIRSHLVRPSGRCSRWRVGLRRADQTPLGARCGSDVRARGFRTRPTPQSHTSRGVFRAPARFHRYRRRPGRAVFFEGGVGGRESFWAGKNSGPALVIRAPMVSMLKTYLTNAAIGSGPVLVFDPVTVRRR